MKIYGPKFYKNWNRVLLIALAFVGSLIFLLNILGRSKYLLFNFFSIVTVLIWLFAFLQDRRLKLEKDYVLYRAFFREKKIKVCLIRKITLLLPPTKFYNGLIEIVIEGHSPIILYCYKQSLKEFVKFVNDLLDQNKKIVVDDNIYKTID